MKELAIIIGGAALLLPVAPAAATAGTPTVATAATAKCKPKLTRKLNRQQQPHTIKFKCARSRSRSKVKVRAVKEFVGMKNGWTAVYKRVNSGPVTVNWRGMNRTVKFPARGQRWTISQQMHYDKSSDYWQWEIDQYIGSRRGLVQRGILGRIN